MSIETISGAAPAALGNAISDAIHEAMVGGMEADAACCIALKVAYDYWSACYDSPFLLAAASVISETVRDRA